MSRGAVTGRLRERSFSRLGQIQNRPLLLRRSKKFEDRGIGRHPPSLKASRGEAFGGNERGPGKMCGLDRPQPRIGACPNFRARRRVSFVPSAGNDIALALVYSCQSGARVVPGPIFPRTNGLRISAGGKGGGGPPPPPPPGPRVPRPLSPRNALAYPPEIIAAIRAGRYRCGHERRAVLLPGPARSRADPAGSHATGRSAR